MIRPDSLLIRFGTFAFSTAFNTALVILLVVAPAASTGAKTWECGERSNLPQEGKNYCAAGDFRQSKVNLAKVYNSMLDQYIAAYGTPSISLMHKARLSPIATTSVQPKTSVLQTSLFIRCWSHSAKPGTPIYVSMNWSV